MTTPEPEPLSKNPAPPPPSSLQQKSLGFGPPMPNMPFPPSLPGMPGFPGARPPGFRLEFFFLGAKRSLEMALSVFKCLSFDQFSGLSSVTV